MSGVALVDSPELDGPIVFLAPRSTQVHGFRCTEVVYGQLPGLYLVLVVGHTPVTGRRVYSRTTPVPSVLQGLLGRT